MKKQIWNIYYSLDGKKWTFLGRTLDLAAYIASWNYIASRNTMIYPFLKITNTDFIE